MGKGSEAVFPVWEEVVWLNGRMVKVIKTMLCQVAIHRRSAEVIGGGVRAYGQIRCGRNPTEKWHRADGTRGVIVQAAELLVGFATSASTSPTMLLNFCSASAGLNEFCICCSNCGVVLSMTDQIGRHSFWRQCSFKYSACSCQ
jgi:hypothetical protein